MTRDPLVVQNYARALFHVIQKQGAPLEEALEEACALRRLLKDQPKLFIFLSGPQFREEDKSQLVEKVFKGNLSDVFYKFLQLLLGRDRIEHLIDILEELRKVIEEAQGLTLGSVTTAIPLSEDDQRDFQEKLEAFSKLKFDLRFRVDPNLIGGVKVKYGDILIDTTLSSYLNDLRRRLAEVRLAS